jgi:hypothetical protein
MKDNTTTREIVMRQNHPQRLRARRRRGTTHHRSGWQSCSSPCPANRSFPVSATTPFSNPRLTGSYARTNPANSTPKSATSPKVSPGPDYNLVAPEKGDTVDLIGWITMNNQSGKTFENAKIKLMAGDVNKIQPPTTYNMRCMPAKGWRGNGGPPS